MGAEKANDLLKYKIPDDIKARIPGYFYYALGGEYVSVFGRDALIRDEDGFSSLDYNSGTAGYVEALKMTCRKLNMDWLFDYWKQLPWYQSDVFDGEIADEVMKCFDSQNNANSYYQYLLAQNS